MSRALDDVRTKGLTVSSLCPVLDRFVETHPEYADVLTPTPTSRAEHIALARPQPGVRQCRRASIEAQPATFGLLDTPGGLSAAVLVTRR